MGAGEDQPDNPEAWLEVYGDHLYGYAMNRLKDRHLAEDVVQETLVSAWRNFGKFEGRSSVKTWLMTIARGRSLDRLRARRARIGSESALGDILALETPSDPRLGPAETVMHVERDAAIERALRELSEREQRVIDLAFFRGMTHPEIAAETGEPLGTIKSQIRRGLMKLHQALKKLEEQQ